MATAEENQTPAPDATEEQTKQLIKVEGYEFLCDTDLIDDVEALDIIHQIEDKNRVSAIVPLLHFLLSDEEYNKLAMHFVKQDAEKHKNVKGYRPRFRATKLTAVYNAVIAQYDPKG